jgi:DNA topoisomerase VI subunit A
MILRELFYFNRETAEPQQDDQYMSDRDTSSLKLSDTRKTRLTLNQINELRRASELHIKEQQAEMEFIARMYAAPVAE